jgi:hypothetical protein
MYYESPIKKKSFSVACKSCVFVFGPGANSGLNTLGKPGFQNGVSTMRQQQFLVLDYYWKTVEKQEMDAQEVTKTLKSRKLTLNKCVYETYAVTVTDNLLRYSSYRKAPPFLLSTWTVASTCVTVSYLVVT